MASRIWISLGSYLQVVRDGGELFEGGLEIFHDVAGDDAGRGEIGGFFEGVVLEPEDVEVHLVALNEVVVDEGLESFGLGALVAVGGAEAGEEVVEVGAA